ncbi:MAG: PadR family transcriptional regulator [Candidatus Lokiarchaeota archaeon]|nr:PadR family transcriptional regulator [Candidatus Lokiarchaeota archaeon]
MVERIAGKFGKAMKKGFISTLILIVLEKEPMHGRQIKKAIEERTFGGWEPTDSTIYTILKDLREKNLIRSIQIPSTDEKTITYEITDDGKNTLEIMIKKEQEIRESMRSIITSTFGIKDELSSAELNDFFEQGSPFARVAHKPDEIETLQILEFQRTFLKKRVEILNQKLQKIEDKITKLDVKNRNEDVS